MMGAAYQAKHGLLQNKSSFDEIICSLPELTLVCKPYDDAESVSKTNKFLNISLLLLCY